MKYSNTMTKLLFSLFLLSITTAVKAQKVGYYYVGSTTKIVQGKLNPTIKTIAVPSSLSNAARITDAADKRIFPSGNNQATAHVSINNQAPYNLLVACEVTGSGISGGAGLGNFYSSDAGLNWNGSEDNPYSRGQPHTEFAATGNKILRIQNGIAAYTFETSLNGGVNWDPFSTPYYSLNNYPQQPNVTIDNSNTSPYINNIYTVFNFYFLDGPGAPEWVVLQRSTNNGLTFNGGNYPQFVGISTGFCSESTVKTGPNGEVYVCYGYRNLQVPVAAQEMRFSRSTDAAFNFTTPVSVPYSGIKASVIGGPIPYGSNPLFNNAFILDNPSMEVDKSNMPKRGRIYITFPAKENGNGKAVIQIIYSDNKGDTWSIPKTISIPGGRQNWSPNVTVDNCTGEAWVIYKSFDTPSGYTTNTYVAHSTDGINWDNQKVSDVSHITAPIGVTPNASGYIGFYIGIAAYGGKAYPVWNDNRNGTWQLYCSPVTAFSINGNSLVCPNSSQVYTLSSYGPTSTVVWSSSVPQISLAPNGQSCTATPNGFIGTYTLTANVTTGCGNTVTVNKVIEVSSNPNPPSLSSIQATWVQNGVTSNLADCNKITDIAVFSAPGGGGGEEAYASGYATNSTATNTTWSVVGGCAYPIIFSTSGNTFNIKLDNYTGSNNNNTYVILRCTFSNACGLGGSVYKDYAFYSYAPICALQPPCAGGTITTLRNSLVTNSIVTNVKPNITELSIAPNPSSGQFQLNLDNLEKEAVFKEIIISNKMGRVVFKQKYTDAQKSKTINLLNQPSDVYIVKIFDGKIWHTQKLSLNK